MVSSTHGGSRGSLHLGERSGEWGVWEDIRTADEEVEGLGAEFKNLFK